eukprot:TRINITY_DN15059_c0_g1_i1.p1 TRINITY_DN15059_c0_g1~~TRINITY_DN15059_c0_g1_i1.p1  ORF type:complete len:372 (-),score=74.52 TRINITY_DN15059_c0_g1_i1:89-1204(-)
MNMHQNNNNEKEFNILFISSLSNATGNQKTAKRIKDYIISIGNNKVVLRCVYSFKNTTDFCTFLDVEKFNLIIGIHAFRSGELLISQTKIPFIIILGGTDMNEHIHDPEKKKIMEVALENSLKIVAFRSTFKDKCLLNFTNINEDKVEIIPPSVPNPNLDNHEYYINDNQDDDDNNFRDILKINPNDSIFILPCGIRAVKNPFYLLDVFDEWYNESDDNVKPYLVIIGPSLDEEYFNRLKIKINETNGIIYHEPVKQKLLHKMIKQSTAVVNSSESEGLSNVLLESMYLQTPIIARDIEGNRCLIKDNETGLLFSNPNEFIEKAKSLIENQNDLKTTLTENAIEYVNKYHSTDKESKQYTNIIGDILENNI